MEHLHLLSVCVCACLITVQLFTTPWTIALQAPLSKEFSRQEWSKLPFPSPVDLPDPGIEPTSPVSPVLQADSLPDKPSGNHPQPHNFYRDNLIPKP